ncbi:hypothetical protein QUW15_13255 [Desulfovibrio piger]|nr:hypothetical protein [Desulfovibrio piger]
MEAQECILKLSGRAGSTGVTFELKLNGDDAWVDMVGRKLMRIGTLMLGNQGFRHDIEALLEDCLDELRWGRGHA